MRDHSSCGCVRVAGVIVVHIVFAPSLHAHRAETRLTVYRAHPHAGFEMTRRVFFTLRVIGYKEK